MTPVAPRIVNNVSYVTRINHDSHFSWQAQSSVTPVAPRIANDVSCVAAIKHECRSFIVFCIPEIAPRNVNDVSCVATINRMS